MCTSPSPGKLARLLAIPVTKPAVDYIVKLTIEVTDYSLDRPPKKAYRDPCHIKFRHFLETVICRAQVPVGMLLATAAYVTRAKPFLCVGKPDWAYERVFLGSLVLATKYHNDNSLSNTNWSMATGFFSSRDVCRVEREMLDVLDYELRIEEDELFAHRCFLFASSPSQSPKSPSSRRSNYVSDDESDSDSESSSTSSADTVSPGAPITEEKAHPHLSFRQKDSKRGSYPPLPKLNALCLPLTCQC